MSHLYTLIERVKRIEDDGMNERDLKERALNIAEYLTWSHDYTQDEEKSALEVLRSYDMESLVNNPDEIERFLCDIYPCRVRNKSR